VSNNIDDFDKALADMPGYQFPGGIKPRRKSRTQEPKVEPADDSWDSTPRIMKRKGVDTEFFRVGALAQSLGLTSAAIRKWESQGRMPLSRYRSPAPKTHGVEGKKPMGHRLYTRDQIEIVILAATEAGVLDPDVTRPNWSKFTKIVVDGWKSKS